MRFLLLTHNFPPQRSVSYNAGTFVLSLAVALSKLGHRVYVLMPDTGEDKENYPEFEIVWFPWRGRKKTLRGMKWYWPGDFLNFLSLMRHGVREAVKLAERERIEYCSALWAMPGGYFAYKVKKKVGIPYSVWVLGADIWRYSRFPLLGPMMREVMNHSHRVFSNSRYLKDEVKKMFGKEAEIIYAIRDLPLDTPAAEVKKDLINFLFIGRYEEVKGLDTLLRAFRLLLDEKNNIFLYVFGGGEREDYYREMITELGLRERVSLGGYATPGTVVSFMKACACLVIPSRRESQAVILTDAIQVKVPVIVTRVGDMSEIVGRFRIGSVVESEDIPGLKRAMAGFMERGRDFYQPNLEKAAETLNTASMAREYLASISRKSE